MASIHQEERYGSHELEIVQGNVEDFSEFPFYQCRAIIVPSSDKRGFIARARRLPSIEGYGTTAEEAVKSLVNQFAEAIAKSLLEKEPIPFKPLRDDERSDVEKCFLVDVRDAFERLSDIQAIEEAKVSPDEPTPYDDFRKELGLT